MALKALAFAVCLTACGPRGDADSLGATAVVDRRAPDFGVVRVTGLSRKEGDLARRNPEAMGVFAAVDSVVAGSPILSGSWRRDGDTLVFVPRFPPSPGVSIWLRLDSALLGRGGGAKPRWWRFEPSVITADTAAPRVMAMFPSADTLPENLLRWYIEFSRPMRPGQALERVHLIDDEGREDRTAFLDTSQELWDPDGRRLTLLFDPGRVKRGIRTNLEQGRPLVAGARFRLLVEPGWQDISGNTVQAGIDKRFVVEPADYEGPDPARWEIRVPATGTVDPLVLSFGESLDGALATRLIAVCDTLGVPITGSVSLEAGERRWLFTPGVSWLPGRYQLRVSPELEDVAGNRPGRPFDRLSTARVGGSPSTDALVRWFEPRSRG